MIWSTYQLSENTYKAACGLKDNKAPCFVAFTKSFKNWMWRIRDGLQMTVQQLWVGLVFENCQKSESRLKMNHRFWISPLLSFNMLYYACRANSCLGNLFDLSKPKWLRSWHERLHKRLLSKAYFDKNNSEWRILRLPIHFFIAEYEGFLRNGRCDGTVLKPFEVHVNRMYINLIIYLIDEGVSSSKLQKWVLLGCKL